MTWEYRWNGGAWRRRNALGGTESEARAQIEAAYPERAARGARLDLRTVPERKPGPGRPRGENSKRGTIVVRLSVPQRTWIEDMASASDRTITECVTALLVIAGMPRE